MAERNPAFDRWWDALALKGDPMHRLNLVREAFDAGAAAVLAGARVAIDIDEGELRRLRAALAKYGDHRRSCSKNGTVKRERVLAAALQQVVLADAEHWEQVRDIARSTLEYGDSMTEAQANHPPGICTCGWDDAARAAEEASHG